MSNFENAIRIFESYKSSYFDILDCFLLDESTDRELIGKFIDGRKFRFDTTDLTIDILENVSSDGMDDEQWKFEFAKRLDRRMRNAYMTPSMLADRIDISDNLIRKYLNAKCIPNARTIRDIARVLKCTVSDLIDF